MQRNLTKGPITVNLLLFALPLMFGNLLQQLYNVADTWVVGRYLGADALAAVGSSYTLMTFLTSILLGLCMGSGAAISMPYGSGEKYFYGILSDRSNRTTDQYSCIPWHGWNPMDLKSSNIDQRTDERLFMGNILRNPCNIFI